MDVALDMLSLLICTLTTVALIVARKRARWSSVRLAYTVAALTVIPLRLTLLLDSMGFDHSVGVMVKAVLGVICNLSFAWIFVMEPPIVHDHGFASKIHGFLHSAATKLYADSQAEGEHSAPMTTREQENSPWNMQHFLP